MHVCGIVPVSYEEALDLDMYCCHCTSCCHVRLMHAMHHHNGNKHISHVYCCRSTETREAIHANSLRVIEVRFRGAQLFVMAQGKVERRMVAAMLLICLAHTVWAVSPRAQSHR
jgi:hypothetical protein